VTAMTSRSGLHMGVVVERLSLSEARASACRLPGKVRLNTRLVTRPGYGAARLVRRMGFSEARLKEGGGRGSGTRAG
jgi:hypothetical protein